VRPSLRRSLPESDVVVGIKASIFTSGAPRENTRLINQRLLPIRSPHAPAAFLRAYASWRRLFDSETLVDELPDFRRFDLAALVAGRLLQNLRGWFIYPDAPSESHIAVEGAMEYFGSVDHRVGDIADPLLSARIVRDYVEAAAFQRPLLHDMTFSVDGGLSALRRLILPFDLAGDREFDGKPPIFCLALFLEGEFRATQSGRLLARAPT
jgi:hypothetical protein